MSCRACGADRGEQCGYPGLAAAGEPAEGCLWRAPAEPEVTAHAVNSGSARIVQTPGRPWRSESWAEFRDAAPDDPAWLVRGWLPEGVLVFLAAPPKKGKTWAALGMSVALATGCPLFGTLEVPEGGCSVLYVALEGSRQALRARIGALARGLELDPDDADALAKLRMLYRPRPFNLADLADTKWLHAEAVEHDAKLVVVDVLRRAAPINENSAEDFARVRDALEPLLVDGRTVALLHHFAKLTENQKERAPGERMSGTGAMFGALDVGLYITRSESGARRLRVELEARDFATPDPLGVVILGTGSGEHGGFTYGDTATMELDPTAAEERDLPAELEALLSDGTWRTVTELASKKNGISANRDDVTAALTESPERFAQVAGGRVGRHVTAKPWGTIAMLRTVEHNEELAQAPEQPEQPEQAGGLNQEAEQVAPLRGANTSNLLSQQVGIDPQPEQAEPPTTKQELVFPAPGEDGYLDHLFAAFEKDLITEGEWRQAVKLDQLFKAASA